jgi:hypothetical protein
LQNDIETRQADCPLLLQLNGSRWRAVKIARARARQIGFGFCQTIPAPVAMGAAAMLKIISAIWLLAVVPALAQDGDPCVGHQLLTTPRPEGSCLTRYREPRRDPRQRCQTPDFEGLCLAAPARRQATFALTRFLCANRCPPTDQVRGHASLENAMD